MGVYSQNKFSFELKLKLVINCGCNFPAGGRGKKQKEPGFDTQLNFVGSPYHYLHSGEPPVDYIIRMKLGKVADFERPAQSRPLVCVQQKKVQGRSGLTLPIVWGSLLLGKASRCFLSV